MPNKIRVMVLMGGKSSEREVSLSSAKEVIKAIDKERFEVTPIEIAKDGKWLLPEDIKDIFEIKKHFDIAFIVMHGKFGEDGTLQGMLEILDLPYVGSGVLASSLAIDKIMTKKILESEKILTPSYQILENTQQKPKNVKFPCVVKPNRQGSSIGASICRQESDLPKAIAEAFRYDDKILIEDYIDGEEVTGAVLEENGKTRALPVTQIIPPGDFFDFSVKYDGSTKEIVPAQISRELTGQVQMLALKTHQILGCRILSRTDMMISKDNKIYVLELNTIPLTAVNISSKIPK